MQFEGWTSTILSLEPLLNRPLFRIQLLLADNSTENFVVGPPIRKVRRRCVVLVRDSLYNLQPATKLLPCPIGKFLDWHRSHFLQEDDVGTGLWLKSTQQFTAKDAITTATVFLVQTNINGPAQSIFDNLSLREL